MAGSELERAARLRKLSAGGVVVGVGVDLVDLDRFRRVLVRTPGVVGRMFTADERSYAEARRDPTESFAARFAAKEAVMKAMGVGVFQVPLTDIEIVRDDDTGEPFVSLHRRASSLAAGRGIVSWQVTMTHIHTTAEAVALALSNPPPEIA